MGRRAFWLEGLCSTQAPGDLIIGIVWALWHLTEFFNLGSTKYALGSVGLILLLIGEVANSIIMTWLYIKTGGSVLVAGVIWHLARFSTEFPIIYFANSVRVAVGEGRVT